MHIVLLGGRSLKKNILEYFSCLLVPVQNYILSWILSINKSPYRMDPGLDPRLMNEIAKGTHHVQKMSHSLKN